MSTQRAAQLIEAGLWLRMSGDLDGAQRLFEQALKLDPNNARAVELVGPAAPVEASAPFEAASPVAAPPAGAELLEMDWASATFASDTPAEPSNTLVFGGPPSESVPAQTAIFASPLPLDLAPTVPFDPPPLEPELTWSDEAAAPPPEEAAPAQLVVPEVAEFVDPMEAPVRLPSVHPQQFAPNATSAWDSHSNPGVHISTVKPGLGAAMDMMEPEPPPSDPGAEEVQTLLQGAKDLLELDDHTGAMDLILKAEALAPNDPQVTAMRQRSEQTLQAMFESRLGAMNAFPRVVLKDDEIIWLNLDHRAGFVLAQIDGTVSFEDLFEVCGMSRLDTARILAQLVDEGVIAAS